MVDVLPSEFMVSRGDLDQSFVAVDVPETKDEDWDTSMATPSEAILRLQALAKGRQERRRMLAVRNIGPNIGTDEEARHRALLQDGEAHAANEDEEGIIHNETEEGGVGGLHGRAYASGGSALTHVPAMLVQGMKQHKHLLKREARSHMAPDLALGPLEVRKTCGRVQPWKGFCFFGLGRLTEN